MIQYLMMEVLRHMVHRCVIKFGYLYKVENLTLFPIKPVDRVVVARLQDAGYIIPDKIGAPGGVQMKIWVISPEGREVVKNG